MSIEALKMQNRQIREERVPKGKERVRVPLQNFKENSHRDKNFESQGNVIYTVLHS